MLFIECSSGAGRVQRGPVQGQCETVQDSVRPVQRRCRGSKGAVKGQDNPVQSSPVQPSPVQSRSSRAFQRAPREAPAAGPWRSHVTASHAGTRPALSAGSHPMSGRARGVSAR